MTNKRRRGRRGSWRKSRVRERERARAMERARKKKRESFRLFARPSCTPLPSKRAREGPYSLSLSLFSLSLSLACRSSRMLQKREGTSAQGTKKGREKRDRRKKTFLSLSLFLSLRLRFSPQTKKKNKWAPRSLPFGRKPSTTTPSRRFSTTFLTDRSATS